MRHFRLLKDTIRGLQFMAMILGLSFLTGCEFSAKSIAPLGDNNGTDSSRLVSSDGGDNEGSQGGNDDSNTGDPNSGGNDSVGSGPIDDQDDEDKPGSGDPPLGAERPNIVMDFDIVSGADPAFGQILHGAPKVAKFFVFNKSSFAVELRSQSINSGLSKHIGMYEQLDNDSGDADCAGITLQPNPSLSRSLDHCVVKVRLNTARKQNVSTGAVSMDRSELDAWSSTHRFRLTLAIYWISPVDEKEYHVTDGPSQEVTLAFNPNAMIDWNYAGLSEGEPMFTGAGSKEVVIRLKESYFRSGNVINNEAVTLYHLIATNSAAFQISAPTSGLQDCNDVNDGVFLNPGDVCAVTVTYTPAGAIDQLRLQATWTRPDGGASSLLRQGIVNN